MSKDIDLKKHIRSIPDFPKPGILFYDISTLLAHAKAWHVTIERMAEAIRPYKPDVLAGIESRGFLLAHAKAWHTTIERLADAIRPYKPDILAGVESRGFLLAAPLALALGTGFVMLRKQGKLPGTTVRHTYALEYGTDTIEIQQDAIKKGARVVLIDDLLATGGTMAAAVTLLEQVGGIVPAAACVMELTFLDGRKRLKVPVETLLKYDS
jgi:adenine phosphoribosyltransferase